MVDHARPGLALHPAGLAAVLASYGVVEKVRKKGPGKNGQAEALMEMPVLVLVADLPQLGTGIGGAGLKEEEK